MAILNKIFGRPSLKAVPERSLDSHLIIFAVCILLPMIGVAVFTSAFLAQRERARFRQGATEQTSALVSALDTELMSSIRVLKAMANSPSLDSDDLGAFSAEAIQMVRSQPDWMTIILITPSGQQVVNTLRPLGTELPAAYERSSLEEVLRTGKPVVGALVDTKLIKGLGFTVRVPVIRGGVTKYVLSAGIDPKTILNLLSSQKLPSSWVIGVVDRNGRIVARTKEPEKYLGKFASKDLLTAVAHAPEGWSEGNTLEGSQVYAAYRKSTFSGWTLAIGIPAQEFEAGAGQTILMIGGGTIAAGLLALWMATLLGKRIVAPVIALVSAAKAMSQGEHPEISTARGITEISILSHAFHEADEAVREREQRFRLIADATPALIWIRGLDKLCTWFNKGWLDFVGRTMEQEIGNGWTANVHPDDLARVMEIYSTGFDSRKSFSMEYRMRCAVDGRYHWVIDKGVPYYNPNGEFAGYIGAAVDITDKQEAEQALDIAARLPLENPAPVWRISSEGKVLYSNPAAAGLLEGLPSSEWERVMHSITAGVYGVLQTGVKQELELQCGERIFSFVIAPITQQGYANLYGFDVTERKQAEAALRDADRRKDEFIALLSHELRNPLAPIHNAVQIIKTINLADDKLDWCRNLIDQQVGYMARLLEDLLDVSRITRDKLELRKKPVQLEEIIDAAVETSRPAIDAKEHKLIVSLPTETITLLGDSARLTQVFANLLNNAAKYTDNCGEIRLLAQAAPAANTAKPKLVMISVKDTGIGIAPELLPHLFDMFFQADSGMERDQGGLGIGLALARKLVEMHGGTIEAKSEGIGKGSEFVVCLPLNETNAPDREIPRNEGKATPSLFSALAKRIVVVDDSAMQAQSMLLLLKQFGYDVRVAHDGPSALKLIAEFLPRVALIDIGLPGMNGYDLARQIRAMPQLKDAVLIAQTGWGRDEDRKRSRQAGFDYHFTKPLDHELLSKVLSEAWAGESATGESAA